MPTRIGLRRTRVRIESLVATDDGQGGQWWGWGLRGVVWAREEPLTSREALMAKQVTAVLQSAWTIPYRSDVSVQDRLLVGARVLQVSSYQDVEGKHAELRVLCSEIQT